MTKTMHIYNAMFGRQLGGIEQAFVDYAKSLLMQGNKVTVFIYPDAPIKEFLTPLGVTIREVKNYGQWDVFAVCKLRKYIQKDAPDVIITHGNRALSLFKRAARHTPVTGVTHNYSFKRLIGTAGAFTISNDLHEKIIEAGHPRERTYRMPNMIEIPEGFEPAAKPYHSPPVIGTLGRFMHKKGFDIYIEALALLKERGISFKALLAGGGKEEQHLKQLCQHKQLTEELDFVGWVKDKAAFFEQFDIFCLPSRHEAFGIVLLEAFRFTMPVITTDSEGPSEVATHNHDALMIPRNDVEALANALEQLLTNQALAATLAMQGFETVKSQYEMRIVGKTLHDALQNIVGNYHKQAA